MSKSSLLYVISGDLSKGVALHKRTKCQLFHHPHAINDKGDSHFWLKWTILEDQEVSPFEISFHNGHLILPL